MLKPDVEMLHAEAGRVYHQGKIYDLCRRASGWAITRPNESGIPQDVFVGFDMDDVNRWLQIHDSPEQPQLD